MKLLIKTLFVFALLLNNGVALMMTTDDISADLKRCQQDTYNYGDSGVRKYLIVYHNKNGALHSLGGFTPIECRSLTIKDIKQMQNE